MVSEEVLGRGAALAVLGEVDGAGPSGEAAALAKGPNKGGVDGAGGLGEAEGGAVALGEGVTVLAVEGGAT